MNGWFKFYLVHLLHLIILRNSCVLRNDDVSAGHGKCQPRHVRQNFFFYIYILFYYYYFHRVQGRQLFFFHRSGYFFFFLNFCCCLSFVWNLTVSACQLSKNNLFMCVSKSIYLFPRRVQPPRKKEKKTINEEERYLQMIQLIDK